MDKRSTESAWDLDPIASMLQRIHFKHVTKGMRSFSVVSQKAHEGKTTVSVLLGRGLHEVYGLKVLLVDSNPEGDGLLGDYLDGLPSQNGFTTGHSFPFSVFRIKDLEVNWLKNVFDSLYFNKLISSFTDYDIVIVDTNAHDEKDQPTLKIKTDSFLVVSSERSFKEKDKTFFSPELLSYKNILGVVFNK